MKNKYLGPYKITSTKEHGEYVIVNLSADEGDQPEPITVSLEYLSEVSSDEPLRWEDFTHKEKLFIAEQMYAILIKHNVQVTRIGPILDHIETSINENTKLRLNELFEKDYNERTVLDVIPRG